MPWHYPSAYPTLPAMAKKTPYLVVTASRTDDGAPVYFRAQSKDWSEQIAEASVVQGESVADELVAVARAQERAVCDPYPMYVDRAEGGAAVPVSARERIRSEGPTTPLRRPDPQS